jgi:hypothetical protein
MTTYRIWVNDHWHFQLLNNVAPEHRKRVYEFRSFEDAVGQVMKDDLAGAQIWKLEGVPKTQIQRLTS